MKQINIYKVNMSSDELITIFNNSTRNICYAKATDLFQEASLGTIRIECAYNTIIDATITRYELESVTHGDVIRYTIDYKGKHVNEYKGIQMIIESIMANIPINAKFNCDNDVEIDLYGWDIEQDGLYSEEDMINDSIPNILSEQDEEEAKFMLDIDNLHRQAIIRPVVKHIFKLNKGDYSD